jgi:hypothetical protein
MGDDRPSPNHRRHRRTIVLAVVAVVAVVLGIGVASVLREAARTVPAFPSLLDAPDPTLVGTVAYVDGSTGCVRIVPLGGGPSRQVYCLPPLDPADAEAKGKPVGPELVWRPDERLRITMFRMTDPPGPGVRPGWQRTVDVTSGAVTETPADAVRDAPDLTTRPAAAPDGRTLAFRSDPASGEVAITVTGADGTVRTLLEARGPGTYTYGLRTAFWGPDGRTVLADDGRILVITTDPTPVVRVLVDNEAGGWGGDDPRRAGFAVTTAVFSGS